MFSIEALTTSTDLSPAKLGLKGFLLEDVVADGRIEGENWDLDLPMLISFTLLKQQSGTRFELG